MQKKFLKAVAAIAMAGAFVGAHAGEREDAMALVDKAVKAVTANKAEGIKQINGGVLVSGEFYIFAYDMSGVLVAHPQKQKDIGKNLLNEGDANGKLFRKDIVEAGKKGSGWVNYALKTKDGILQEKTAFCKKATDIVLCTAIVK